MRTLNLIRYHLTFFLEGLRKITEKSPGQEFNLGLSEYEARVLNFNCNIQFIVGKSKNT
jgi:hypothetical protein